MRKSFITFAAAATAAASLASVSVASAAENYYMKIDGVTGSTTVGKTTGAIQINSFQWGAENTTTIGSMASGAGAGKASFDKLTITKPVDATSPVLLQKLGQDSTITGMEIVGVRSGAAAGTAPVYAVRYCFEPAFVTDDTQSGSGSSDSPTESISFAFGAMQEGVTGQNADGSATPTVFGSWDQLLNSTSLAVPSGNACATSRFS